MRTFFALEVLIFCNGALGKSGLSSQALQIILLAVLLYTVGLLTTTILTAFSFDTEVWYRDIDASPSPFPVPVLVAYIFPCFFPQTSELGPDPTTDEDGHPHCLPGCNCTKASPPETSSYLIESMTGNNSFIQGSKSRSLVRLPNETERRTSITIAFDVL
jgi:hypothetical protein